ASRLPVVILANVRRFRGGSGQQLSSVSSATLTCHENHAAPTFGVAASGICMWINRILGITLHPKSQTGFGAYHPGLERGRVFSPYFMPSSFSPSGSRKKTA